VEGERAERVAGAVVTEVENLMVEVTVTGEEAADGEEVESQGVVLTMLEESQIWVKESGECLAVSMLLAEVSELFAFCCWCSGGNARHLHSSMARNSKSTIYIFYCGPLTEIGPPIGAHGLFSKFVACGVVCGPCQ